MFNHSVTAFQSSLILSCRSHTFYCLIDLSSDAFCFNVASSLVFLLLCYLTYSSTCSYLTLPYFAANVPSTTYLYLSNAVLHLSSFLNSCTMSLLQLLPTCCTSLLFYCSFWHLLVISLLQLLLHATFNSCTSSNVPTSML
jgi:hypothetical protein